MELLCLSWTSKQTMGQTFSLLSLYTHTHTQYPTIGVWSGVSMEMETTTTAIEEKQNYRKIPINFFARLIHLHMMRSRSSRTAHLTK